MQVENGPKHNLKFTAHVLVGGKRLGWAVGKTKKAAEQVVNQVGSIWCDREQCDGWWVGVGGWIGVRVEHLRI